MLLEEIKAAVLAGKIVHWKSSLYKVVYYDGNSVYDDWNIVCTVNHNCIGLTWSDGVTMNGEPEDFYIGD